MSRLALLLVMLLTGALGPSSPDEVADLAWQPAPGTQLPVDMAARDENGDDVKLRDFLTGVPIVLDLGYYHCPSLCGVARADLIQALAASGLVSGRDYALIALSIDPRETPRDAARAKAADVARAERTAGTDWHYLTASEATIATVEADAGFRSRYDPVLDQYPHPAGLVVLTSRGVVSGYLPGVGYSAGDVRAAVIRARDGGIAGAALPILLLCFRFDQATGHYTLAIERVLQLMALLTVDVLGGMLLLLHRRGPRMVSVHGGRPAGAGRTVRGWRRHRLDILHAAFDLLRQRLRRTGVLWHHLVGLFIDRDRPEFHHHDPPTPSAGDGLVSVAVVSVVALFGIGSLRAGDPGAGDAAGAVAV